MVWHFIGVYIINRTLHDRLEIRNFSSRVEKYFTRSLRSLVKYFSTLEEKFRISARPCNILYIFLTGDKLKNIHTRGKVFLPAKKRDPGNEVEELIPLAPRPSCKWEREGGWVGMGV